MMATNDCIDQKIILQMFLILSPAELYLKRLVTQTAVVVYTKTRRSYPFDFLHRKPILQFSEPNIGIV